MKRILVLLTISILMFSGIRVPEVHEGARGFCFSGAVLEKAVAATQDAFEFHKAAENPLLLHSGFAPSAHPFDFPEASTLSDVASSNFLVSRVALLPSGNSIFPHDRPPIAFSF